MNLDTDSELESKQSVIEPTIEPQKPVSSEKEFVSLATLMERSKTPKW